MERPRNNIAMGGEALCNCIVDSTGVNVSDSHGGTAGLSGHGGGQEANSSGPENQRTGSRSRCRSVDGVQGDRKWLEERCGVERHMVRKSWVIC